MSNWKRVESGSYEIWEHTGGGGDGDAALWLVLGLVSVALWIVIAIRGCL